MATSRFAISAWVGAACLFIATTLQDVHSTTLDSVAKAELAVQRFPVYYNFAFVLLGIAFVLGCCGLITASTTRKGVTLQLLLLPLVLTAIDYVWIYQPLDAMTVNVQQARPAQFVTFHSASKWINIVQVSASVIAAIAVCWPVSGGVSYDEEV
ncbi:MAG: hypothetical protein KDA89_18105 [Planctomycetaceae bacterium]|nr:hypothetical protein [Planctomycetaceae bacterium]